MENIITLFFIGRKTSEEVGKYERIFIRNEISPVNLPRVFDKIHWVTEDASFTTNGTFLLHIFKKDQTLSLRNSLWRKGFYADNGFLIKTLAYVTK